MDTAALASIHAAFSQPVTWSQGPVVVEEITAIPLFGDGDDPFAQGNSVKQRGWEIPVAMLPFRPVTGDIVDDGAKQWRVIDVEDYEEAEAWRVSVEAVAL